MYKPHPFIDFIVIIMIPAYIHRMNLSYLIYQHETIALSFDIMDIVKSSFKDFLSKIFEGASKIYEQTKK